MIIIIGSINMDLILRVPHPGETLSGGHFQTIPGGKGANQAVACARLSADSVRVAMIACLGDDAFGVELRAALSSDGIDDTHVSTIKGVASGMASILVDANGQNSIVLAAGANDALSPAHIDAARALIAQSQIVVLQLETPLPTILHAIKLVHDLGKVVVLNPAPAHALPADFLTQVQYLIPNEIEVAMLAGLPEASLDSDASIDPPSLHRAPAAATTYWSRWGQKEFMRHFLQDRCMLRHSRPRPSTLPPLATPSSAGSWQR